MILRQQNMLEKLSNKVRIGEASSKEEMGLQWQRHI